MPPRLQSAEPWPLPFSRPLYPSPVPRERGYLLCQRAMVGFEFLAQRFPRVLRCRSSLPLATARSINFCRLLERLGCKSRGPRGGGQSLSVQSLLRFCAERGGMAFTPRCGHLHPLDAPRFRGTGLHTAGHLYKSDLVVLVRHIAWSDYTCLASGRPVFIINVAYTMLERRLQCRAVGLAMSDLLGRFRAAADNEDPPPRLRSWLYVRLYYRFAAMCRTRSQQDSVVVSRLYGFILVPVMVFSMITYVAVGRCIAVWQLALFAHAAYYFTLNAVNLAARNALLDSIALVYRDAQRELRALSLWVGAGPLADELALHDRAVSTFLDIAHYRSRFFGFVVSFSTIRTMWVTALTVAVALWSIMRALNVGLTMESFCPATV
ncbi:hypothetical protein DFJ74DRAFT_441362 [Hyaloraphidium curvatum]|nr:hypothetical protein DFJ74DRAFT_441362 [Hyaloraphidium curvatum]